MKIVFDGSGYKLLYAEETSPEWYLIKDQVDGKYLSTEVAGGFVGTVFAMYATSSGMLSDSKATFEWFSYEGQGRIYK